MKNDAFGPALAEVVSTTPRTIRLILLIGIFLILVAAAISAIVAVWNGRAVSIVGLKIDEFHSPDVQKCSYLASTFPAAATINSDELRAIYDEIAHLEEYIFKIEDTNDKLAAGDPSTQNERNYLDERYRAETKEWTDYMNNLHIRAEAISNARLSSLSDLKNACGSQAR